MAVRSVGVWACLGADLDALRERKISYLLPRIEFLGSPAQYSYTQHGLSCANLSSAVCGNENSLAVHHSEVVVWYNALKAASIPSAVSRRVLNSLSTFSFVFWTQK